MLKQHQLPLYTYVAELLRDDTAAPFTDAPAVDVLHSLQLFAPFLDELRLSPRSRPQARIARSSQPVSHASWLEAENILGLANALSVRARAQIALGNTAEAHADIFALQRYTNGLTAHPATLLELLIGLDAYGSAQRAIADGIQRHAWTDAQLAGFQNQLARIQPLAAFRECVLTERAVAFYVIDSKPPPTPERPRWLFHGWAQQNKVSLYRLQQSEVFSTFTIEPARMTPPPPKPPRPPAGLFGHWISPCAVLSRMITDNVLNILIGFGSSVDRLTLSSVAYAAERHRLAHGRYPDSLSALVPLYLPAIPTGIFDSEPIRYLALPDGAHQLRTSGKNGRDDQGTADDTILTLPKDT